MTTQALNIIRASFCIFADFAAAPLEFSPKVPNTRPVGSGGSARQDFGRFLTDNRLTYGGNPGLGRFPGPGSGVKPASASGGRV